MVQTANELTGSGATGDSLGLSEDELAASLQQIATEEFAATESMATEINVNQAGNVITRLVELRRNVRGFSLAGLNYPGKTQTLAADTPDLYAGGGQRGGAASADQPGGRLGAFINGSYSTGDRDDTVWTNEFDFDTYGLTGGVDYRFTDNLVFGLALSYHDVDADFDEKPTVSGGSVDADGWGGFLYGTWYADRFYVDALAGYAKTDYDTKRDIFIPNNNDPTQNINETAKGSPDSDDYTVGIGAGYTLGSGALSYGPYARLTYYEVDIDDYQEKGAEASGLNLKVDGQDWESLTTVLGAQVSYAISQNFGVIVPQGQVGWVHEFENDSEEFTAVYVDDPRQNELRAETNDPDRDYFEVGLGVSAVFKGGTQAFIYYDTVLGFDDLTDHIVTVGGRMEF
jgi:outer membrane autotransporter protein